MARHMTTYSKIKFNPLAPLADDISIDDIAHALSLMCRANGHIPEFYSVAQHSIYCCEEALAKGFSKRVALACLLHDGSEAYLADITRPVKPLLSNYLEIEKELQDIIYKKFIGSDLTSEEITQVGIVDDVILYNEFVHYMSEELPLAHKELSSTPVFKFVDFKKIEERFKELFYTLTK